MGCNYEPFDSVAQAKQKLKSSLAIIQHSQDRAHQRREFQTSSGFCHLWFTPIEKGKLHTLAAVTVFQGGLPLYTFHKVQKHRRYDLVTPPNRQTTDKKLHERCFEQAKGRADQFLSEARLLNLTTDVSDDKNKIRVANLSMSVSGHGGFYLQDLGSGGNTQAVVYLYHLLKPLLVAACGGDTTGMNRLATYTRSNMRGLHRCLLVYPQFSYVFTILCEPRWLQLFHKRLHTIRSVKYTKTKGSQLPTQIFRTQAAASYPSHSSKVSLPKQNESLDCGNSLEDGVLIQE